MNQQAIFGFQEEWEQFQTRNEKFLSKYSALQAALDKAFSRTVSTSKPGDRVIFGLGRLCAEDFLEILLLAGNGYGVAALKLLRGLYERAVTISYLSEHPGEATAFLDYHFVSQHKVLTELRAIGLEERFPRDEREKVEAEYQRVKHNYLVTGCKECGAKRMNHTWSKLDVVAMAKSTDLGKLLAMAYYRSSMPIVP